MSTILKWAGNKTAVMPEIKKHLPQGQRLVELFAGSCSVMMNTDYPGYLIADALAALRKAVERPAVQGGAR